MTIQQKMILFLIMSGLLLVLSSCKVEEQFTIIYHTNMEDIIVTVDDIKIEQFQLLDEPVREGYRFEGWYLDDETFLNSFKGKETLQESTSNIIQLYAKWEIVEYEIHYIGLDNSILYIESMVYKEDLTNLFVPESIEGHRFIGWFLDEDFNDEIESMSMPANNVMLYGKWEMNQYLLTIMDWDQSILRQVEVEFGSLIRDYFPENPNRIGYHFVGFDQETIETMPAEPVVLTALYEIIVYYVEYDSKGGSDVATQEKYYLDVIDTSIVPIFDKHVFIGWFLDEEGTIEAPLVMGDSNITLYAIWDSYVEVEVSFDLNGGSWKSDVFQMFDSDATHISPTRNDTSGTTFTILTNQAMSYRWFYKVFIAYDVSIQAYTIVAVDSATANIVDLTLPEYDYVLVVHDNTVDREAYQTIRYYASNSTSIGTIVVFDTEDVMSPINVSFYSSTVLNLKLQALFSTNETLPQPKRTGFHFVGWSNGEEVFLFLPIFTESMDIHELTLTAEWEPYSTEEFSNWIAPIFYNPITQNITLPIEFGDYAMVWESSDDAILSSTGLFTRPYQATMIWMMVRLYYEGVEISMIFEARVEGYKSLDAPIASSYIYRSFNQVTNDFFQTLDIINVAFITASATGSLSGNTFLNNVQTHILPKAKQYGNWVVLSVAPESKWSEIAASSSVRAIFASNLVAMINQYGFDGVDIDWEYPTHEEKEKFTLLMKEVYEQVKANNPNHLVTAAIAGGRWQPPRYDLLQSAQYIDYINMMTYSMTSNSGYYQNALHPSSSFHLPSMSVGRTLVSCSIEESVEIFENDFQIPRSKIIVGAAFYGVRQVRTYNSTTSSWSDWARGSSVFYHNIVANYLNNPLYTRYFDPISKVPFLVKNDGTEFISYDDPESIIAKSNYIIIEGLGGMMYWENGTDLTGDLLAAMKQGFQK